MEDHVTSSGTAGTGSSSVTMATDSMGTDPDLRVLCNRVKVLEQRAGSAIQSDSYLRNRIRELERSERSLLLQLYQLASASHLPSMQHSQRLDQRLLMLREEVRTMTQEKERGEQVWRERLQRCQRQLKSKEDELSRQSQYFENFKTQLQHKLSLARDREQSLQNRIYTLEKQLLDMTVSAATSNATIRAVRITAGTVTHWGEQDRLTFMRGEGEGEEEKKEERRKQWQPSVGAEREGGREGDEGKAEKQTEGGRNKDAKQNSNEARLQGFILSLQEDLRVLLEREEDGMTERRGLVEQLQEAQENSHFLGCKVEEMKAEVHQLRLSESSLMEEVEELREENHRLQQILREAANQTPSQSSMVPERACPSPGTSSPGCSRTVCPPLSDTQSYPTTKGRSSVGSSGEVQPTFNGAIDQSHSSAVLLGHHQEAAESTQNNTDDHSSSAKSDSLNLFAHRGPKHNLSLQSLSLTTETVDEFKLGAWSYKGLLNLEESPSEESDALREAYRSLGIGDDLEALREQRDRLEAALKHTQEQLEVLAQENTQLKLQLRKQVEEREAEQGSSKEKIGTPPTTDGADHLLSSPTQDNTILALAQDDLVQALNQENRALADRIQELLAHIELREEEIKTAQTQLREHISGLEEDRARLEHENQEQGCLVTELTRKTEDDLNTIMELQQKLEENKEQNDVEIRVDSLVESVLKGDEEPQMVNSQQPASASGPQHNNHHNPLQSSPQNPVHVSSLTDQVGHLTKTVQSLKTQHDELTGNIKSLREQQAEVALSVQTQTEEKQQLTRTVWGLKEEKDLIAQCLAEETTQRQHLLNPNTTGATKKMETLVGTGDYAAQRCHANSYKGNSTQQEQSDLMREIEALGAQLKRSLEELDKSHTETKKLHGELCQSESGREEAERKADQAAEEVMRLTDVAGQMEETRRENESLNTQIKELQSKLRGLVREKTDALSLKTQTEEQYNILTAQLKAKTVALEELNSEYIALKRGQGSKDDLSTALTSLRTRYNDIRAKYDALLKKRSQTDLDIAPLKAKLSCLVVKCQERNNLLVQMMKAMHRHRCVDATLTQQVEELLSDAALQDYASAFTPGSIIKTTDHSAGFTPRFISKFQDYTSGLLPDQTCTAVLTPANEQRQNGFITESGVKCRDLKSEKQVSVSTTQSSINLQDCRSEVTPAATGTLQSKANSPVPTTPVQEIVSVEVTPVFAVLKESLITKTAQLSASASGPIQAGSHHPDMTGKSSPDLTSSTGSSLSPAPPSPSTRLSPSRRLSSPEKIINLHEQLQNTLMSSYQAPVTRGRGQEPNMTAPTCNIFNGAAPAYDGLALAASRTQSAHRSPERSNKSAGKSTAALDKTKTARPRPEAPAEVRSVEVIKAVGQSSLMIGWERPPLDELGCSNGTFVYGYRVFIDGDFHKSVMSSACTKCIVENVDLSVPVHISWFKSTMCLCNYKDFSVKTFLTRGRGVNTIYSCSPLRDRPNLHLS
ncbi:plectin-like protein [Lates japonicus]|uniref:Plectin-like protein n=1 Tax=Lates japonicus TaxID=270547 RepID=A0AAD3N9Q0_LATJO|nr:plectin-like protein [Lates japonicus]